MEGVSSELLGYFRSPSYPGSFFLSFEGIEGAGKSTQALLAQNHLERKNFRVIVLREPGGTSFGEHLRKAILESHSDIHPLAEAYLFASSRVQILHDVILKELHEPNTVVICDRYIDSSLAYQGVARGLGIDHILKIHTPFPLNLLPHRSFYMKISVDTSRKRQKIRNAPKDYFESRNHQFFEDLILGYDLVARLFTERVRVIDGEEDISTISQAVLSEVDKLLESPPTTYAPS